MSENEKVREFNDGEMRRKGGESFIGGCSGNGGRERKQSLNICLKMEMQEVSSGGGRRNGGG